MWKKIIRWLNTRTGYKMVHIGTFCSKTKYQSLLESCIYEIGKWTKPEEGQGPLCIYKNKKYVYNTWISPYGDEKLFKCKYIRSKHNKVWTTPRGLSDYSERNLDNMPKGTILADEVMIYKKIIIPDKVFRKQWDKENPDGCYI